MNESRDLFDISGGHAKLAAGDSPRHMRRQSPLPRLALCLALLLAGLLGGISARPGLPVARASNAASSSSTRVGVRSLSSVPYARGDVFAGLNLSSQIKQFDPTGALRNTLETTSGSSYETGMCFDTAGNLYSTNFSAGTTSKFDNSGNLLAAIYASGFSNPESCVFDTAGNQYVGGAGSNVISKLDSTGHHLITYTVATENVGTDWIDLASDQCTIYYTSEGPSVLRFNVCTNTQLPAFATGLGKCYALRIRPITADVLVACAAQAYRLDATTGAILQTYTPEATGETSPFLFALNLDSDGTSFWTADLNNGSVFRVDIAAATVITSFIADPGGVDGLAIFGEQTAAQPTATSSSTATSTPGNTDTPTATPVPPTATMTPTVTSTPVPPTATAVPPSPTVTATSAPLPTGTPLPTSFVVAPVVVVPTNTPTNTPTLTPLPTAVPATSTATQTAVPANTATATLQPTQTPISAPAVPPAPVNTDTATAVPATATATTVVTGCAVQPFSFAQPGTVPTGTAAATGSALSLAAGATLIAPNGQYALVAPAGLSAAVSVTFSSATEFTLASSAGTSGGAQRIVPPVQVLLPTGMVLSVLEPSTGQFRMNYDKRGTWALTAGSYKVEGAGPVHFSSEVALDVLALGNEPLTVCSGNPVRLYAATFPGDQVTISAFGQDQTGTADSAGQVQFTLTAPSVDVATTETYTAQATHTRANGGVTTLKATQRFRVIPATP